MKIAITVQKDCGLESEMDQRFGRSQGFLIVDSDTNECHYVSNNQNLNAPQGAGIQAAQTVVAENVQAVLTGHCGPKAFAVLSSNDVKVFVGNNGTAKSVVDEFKAGKLTAADNPDVQGHW